MAKFVPFVEEKTGEPISINNDLVVSAREWSGEAGPTCGLGLVGVSNLLFVKGGLAEVTAALNGLRRRGPRT